MPASWILLIVLVLAAAGYVLARGRAMASAGGDQRRLHSLPSYYGTNAAMAAAVPALGLLAVWLIAQPMVSDLYVSSGLPEAIQADAGERSLAMADVRRVADGLDYAVSQGAMTREEAANLSVSANDIRERLGAVGIALGSDVDETTLELAQQYRNLTNTGNTIRTVLVLLVALASFGAAYMMTAKDFRARNIVEFSVRMLLIGAASIAILTTLGIVLSLVFNTIEFFRLYPAADFFFGLNWAPSFSGRGGSSDLGVLPLLWGTLYVSIVALALAGLGTFWWEGRAQVERAAPPPEPLATTEVLPELPPSEPGDMVGPAPPEASELTREQRRFFRYDRNRDWRITRTEMLSSRTDAFRKLDKDGNNLLDFEEWAVATVTKFEGADADGDNRLTPAEFATTAPKPRRKPRCAC